MANAQQKWLSVSPTKGVSTEGGDAMPFPVLCMFDFADSTDTGDEVLSFKKGEILDIIECRDDLGWWAAMGTEGSKLGWISKLYVQRLSKEMAEKLRKIPQVVRVHEYNAEQLYNSPVDPGVNRRR